MLNIKCTFKTNERLGEVTAWKEMLNAKPFYKEKWLTTETVWSCSSIEMREIWKRDQQDMRRELSSKKMGGREKTDKERIPPIKKQI
jgi:hypothetical protein